jgi:hypothetical protein
LCSFIHTLSFAGPKAHGKNNNKKTTLGARSLAMGAVPSMQIMLLLLLERAKSELCSFDF